ncbi:MAG: cytochrome c-type biogenesis protein CcmH [Nitrospinae bacterium]|jgi:cytochrome c-type biogenesis protein CcmH|nr:cytochrome c-type biogenesis protein CcmH [Nitrospinota bacterium]MDA1109786.1 cytochrome c-type biogenesis protein CcmH [Nitrospinota bacterium]
MMKTKSTIFAILLAMFLVVGFASSAGASAQLADLENALMCKCDDKCGKVLVNCTCSTSDKTRAEFSKLLDSGLTVEQIIKAQIDKHGETILSAPSKTGFNLTAWMTPFVALLAGGFGLGKIIEAWKRKGAPEDNKAEAEDAPAIPKKYSDRLRDELDNIES